MATQAHELKPVTQGQLTIDPERLEKLIRSWKFGGDIVATESRASFTNPHSAAPGSHMATATQHAIEAIHHHHRTLADTARRLSDRLRHVALAAERADVANAQEFRP